MQFIGANFKSSLRSDLTRTEALKRDGCKLNRHHALAHCLRMIFSENRHPPRIQRGAGIFRIMP
jgi:hypothetical protein